MRPATDAIYYRLGVDGIYHGDKLCSQMFIVKTLNEQVARIEADAKVNGRLTAALKWYANPKHWGRDDWGVMAVVVPPEYGKPGTKARAALEGGSDA